MPRLLTATFNIPCSGAGTFVLLTTTEDISSTRRDIYGINVDSAGNQNKCNGADEFKDISITINNGIATVKVYVSTFLSGTSYFRCCFIPGDPFDEQDTAHADLIE